MAKQSLARYLKGGLLGLHFTPEELFVGVGHLRGRSFVISALDHMDIRPHLIEGGDFNHATMVPALQSLLKQHKIKTHRAVVSFPVKFPWIRVLDLPASSEREMGRIVRLEVERLYLDSTVEKLIDYYPLSSPGAGANGASTVLSVAIPRNSVAPYVELTAAARLELVGIDLAEINVLKIAALQGVNFEDGITLILNFNMQSTDLMLMERGTLQLVRKVGQGKQQLREALLRVLPEDSMSRTQLGRVDFVLPPEELTRANEYVSSLLGEIRRSIEFYLAEMKRAEGNVSRIVLGGSGFWPANLAEILALQLNLQLIELRFEGLPHVICESPFSREFPACAVYAPVLGSVVRGAA